MFESRRKLRRRRDRLFVRRRRLGRHEQVILSILAVLIGAAAAYGAIAFRWTIGAVQLGFFGFSSERGYGLAAERPWWQVLLAPAAGGLLIGLFIHYVMPGRLFRRAPQAVGRKLGVRLMSESM